MAGVGRYTLHEVPGRSVPAISRQAAKKLDHPPGTFAAYHPDMLMAPRLPVPDDWVAAAQAAEHEIAEFERRHGESASRIGWVLQRSECLGSSTIEDVSPSLRRVARAEAAIRGGVDAMDQTAREAVGSIAATRLAAEIGDSKAPVAIDDVLGVHASLMEHTGKARLGGRLRDGWVRIGGVLGGYPPPSYVAPPAEEVPRLMDDLLAYINHSGDHPLVVAAVSHAQFESIHPFGDGNGRAGRALIAAVLRRRGVTSRTTLPISAVLATNRDAYISALSTTRYEGSPTSPERASALDQWVDLFTTSSSAACGYAERMIRRVESAADGWAARTGGRRGAAEQRVLASLTAMPVFTVSDMAEQSGVNPSTAYKVVRKLESAGIIVPTRGKLRGRGLYEVPDMLDLFKDDQDADEESTLEAPVSGVAAAPLAFRHDKAAARRDKAAEAVKLRVLGRTHKEIGETMGMSTAWAQRVTAGVPRGDYRGRSS